ncbi:glycosyltransferase family 4 protein [Actinoplanes sp. NPDC049316]|uniref:glycosyltransferase family 4 protein n=1 Tax=Actinoplanes sp. NPDC049316 TaxID=3154727 RepID=UPI0034459BF5
MSLKHIAVLNWRDRDHPRAGGAELYCERVAAELVDQGATVTYVTAAAAGHPPVEERDGFRIVRRGGVLGVYPAALLWLWRHRREIDGVVDSQNGIPFFSPLVVGRRVPVVLLIHHVHQRQFPLYFRWPMSAVGRLLERRGTALIYRRGPIVTVSPSSRHAIRQQLGLKGPVVIAPCGTDLPAAPGPSARAPFPRIVLVTRLVRYKRIELVLQAVAQARRRVPDLELHIVGDGPHRPVLVREIERLGLADCVTVHGWVDEAEKTELLRTAWFTVSASVCEGWGLSLVEASALGVPVVAVRVPGVRDAVRDGSTGILVDEAHFAGAIADMAELLADDAEAERWRLRARAWAAGFHWRRTAAQIRYVLEASTHHGPGATERRTAGDVATVIELTGAVPDVAELQRLTRRTDSWSRRGETVVGLLRNADEVDALTVARRLGLSTRPGIEIRVRLARPYDLLRYA